MKLYIAVFFCILTVCISVLVVVPNSATIKLGRVTLGYVVRRTMQPRIRCLAGQFLGGGGGGGQGILQGNFGNEI